MNLEKIFSLAKRIIPTYIPRAFLEGIPPFRMALLEHVRSLDPISHVFEMLVFPPWTVGLTVMARFQSRVFF
jgi:hypothetical protein